MVKCMSATFSRTVLSSLGRWVWGKTFNHSSNRARLAISFLTCRYSALVAANRCSPGSTRKYALMFVCHGVLDAWQSVVYRCHGVVSAPLPVDQAMPTLATRSSIVPGVCRNLKVSLVSTCTHAYILALPYTHHSAPSRGTSPLFRLSVRLAPFIFFTFKTYGL